MSDKDRFTALVDRVLMADTSKIKRHIAERKERARKNPNRRGPKSKASVSGRDGGV